MRFFFIVALLFFWAVQSHAQRFYVTQNGAGAKDGSSWANAWGANEFGLEIYTVVSGAEIWLARGVYLPFRMEDGSIPNQIGASTYSIPRGVKIYGGFQGSESSINDRIASQIHTINKTVLSADSGSVNFQGDNLRNLISMKRCGAGEVMDGLTIGYALNSGIELRFEDPVIQTPVFNNCIIRDNYPFGGSFSALNIFGGNPATLVDFRNCYFYNNGTSIYGYGAIGSYNCRLIFSNCTFNKNFSGQGITGYNYAGCLHVQSGSAKFVNSTFFGNNDGPVLSSDNATDSIRIDNCIFWKNVTANGVFPLNVRSGLNLFTIKNSVFPTPTVGSIPAAIINQNTNDPGFVNEVQTAGLDNELNTADDGLRLTTCTRIANTGDNSLVIASTDYLGQPRIFGSSVDPGSFELQSDTASFTLTLQPSSQQVCLGSNATFASRATGPNVQYQWQEKTGTVWINLTDNAQVVGSSTADLNILAPGILSSGRIFRCYVSNASCPDLISAEATLSVNQAINVTGQPVRQETCIGGSATFSVTVSSGTYAYQWQIKQGPDWVNLVNGAPYAGVSNQNLIISNVQPGLFGSLYRCIITGGCNAVATDSAELLQSAPITRLYVNATSSGGNGLSWASAFPSIDDALRNLTCLSGPKEIWVAKGTYYPVKDASGNYSPANPRWKLFLLPSGVKIYGGFSGSETSISDRDPVLIFTTNATILSADIDFTPGDSLNNAYRIMEIGQADSTTRVDGFVFEGVYNNLTGIGYGGALVISQPPNFRSEPTIANCLFRRNYGLRGSALYMAMQFTFSKPIVKNCRFIGNGSGNRGAAIAIDEVSNPFLTEYKMSVDSCVFENNVSSGTTGSAVSLIISITAAPFSEKWGLDITNSIFRNNIISGGGSTLYVRVPNNGNFLGKLTVANCVFDSNVNANNGGAAAIGRIKATISNSTFFNNQAGLAAGALAIAMEPGVPAEISNCIFWNNRAGSQINNVQSMLANNVTGASIYNSIFQGQQAVSPPLINCIDSFPQFVDTINRAGADNIWGTSDDGLALASTSPAKDAGLNSKISALTPRDITGGARVQGCRVDMGAYENQSSSYFLNTLYAANQQVCTQYPIGTGTQTFVDTVSCSAMATITPNGVAPLGGPVQVCVANDPAVVFVNGVPYVPRRYDIIPSVNAANATARITVYYTQQDFDAYNSAAIGFPQLPTGPLDLAGIANVLIEQNHGISLTGVPGSYTGPTVFINPEDSSVKWNVVSQLWEVSFDVVGFSGFFVRTLNTVPAFLLSFNGQNFNEKVILQWKTHQEINTAFFDVVRSKNGLNFESVARVPALGRGDNEYQYIDGQPLSGDNYYRLLIFDRDGQYQKSEIIHINRSGEDKASVTIFPNPVTGVGHMNIKSPNSGWMEIALFDLSGRKLKTIYNGATIRGNMRIPIEVYSLPKGLYQLLVILNGQYLRENLLVQ